MNFSFLAPVRCPPLLDLLSALAHHHPDAEIALLHSSTGDGSSVLATNPLVTVEVDHLSAAHLSTHSKLAVPPPMHPLAALQAAIDSLPLEGPHPLLGWLGFLAYPLAHTLEAIGQPRADPISPASPLLRFSLYRHYLLHDPLSQTVTPYSLTDDPEVAAALVETPPAPDVAHAPSKLIAAPTHFTDAVRAAQVLIADGHIYQANLAQRWSFQIADPPHAIYRRLCECTPAPYGAYLQFRDVGNVPRHILSASPELFLALQGRHALTRPIKGTRRRDLLDPVADRLLAEELLASGKDRAELAMIVDLLRNDLGRAAAYGSVKVTQARQLERHPTVWHTVASIEAELRAGARLGDLLRGMLPAGSVTGVPKIRACQIINELEPVPRHLYCGQIGAISPGGNAAALNIAIRTVQVVRGVAHVYSGAGITADSGAEEEHEETLHKARGLFEALGWRNDE